MSGRLKKKSSIRLGVNLDHVATLRQVRGGTTSYPDLKLLAKEVVKAGADQITIHLREDRRHIQETDLAMLSKLRPTLLNLEMAMTSAMEEMALRYKPDWVCLVPEKREELTTEGGLNVVGNLERLKSLVTRMKNAGIKSSMFIEPSLEQIEASSAVGADAVELHTGHWVLLKDAAQAQEWQRLKDAAIRALKRGLHVHAGHGLDDATTRKILKLPGLEEVNIGHFIICDSLHRGLAHSVKEMKKILRQGVK